MMDCKIKHNKDRKERRTKTNSQRPHESCHPEPKVEIETCGEQSRKEEKLIEIVEDCFCKKVTRMKEQALLKASRMIQLLYEEKDQLEKQLQTLKQVLQVKEETIAGLKQLIQEQIYNKQKETPKRSCQQQASRDKSAIVANDLFFSFSNPKSKELKPINTYDKNLQETRPGLTFSKQFQPWRGHENVIETLAQAISREEVSTTQFRELDKLVSIQIQKSLALAKQIQFQKEQFQDQLLLYETSEIAYTVGSQQKLTTQSQSKVECIQDLIRKYQGIICSYRQYSAFLRASLCEATNFISKMGQMLGIISSQPMNYLAQLSKMVDIFKSRTSSILQTQEQNQQLRTIIDGLLKNIEVISANIIN